MHYLEAEKFLESFQKIYKNLDWTRNKDFNYTAKTNSNTIEFTFIMIAGHYDLRVRNLIDIQTFMLSDDDYPILSKIRSIISANVILKEKKDWNKLQELIDKEV